MNYTTKNLYNVPMRCDPIVNISYMYYTTENLSLELHFSHNNASVNQKLLLYLCRKYKQCCNGNFHQIFVHTKKWNMESSVYGVYPLMLISFLQVKRRRTRLCLLSKRERTRTIVCTNRTFDT